MAKTTGKWIVSDVALAGNPTTTTQADGDNSTKIATTAFVQKTAGSESAKIGHLVTLSGVAINSDNLGAFTGAILSNSETVKSADQKLSDAVEAAQGTANAASTSAATANSDLASHVGNTSNPHSVTKAQVLAGNLIDNNDVDEAAGIEESKLALDHSTASMFASIGSDSAKIGHLETLSGVASGSDNLGAFTGPYLSASETIKTMGQKLSDAIGSAANAPSAKEILTITTGDLSAGYIDLAHIIVTNSLMVTPVGGPLQEQGVDYTISQPGSVTRVTFAGDLAATLANGDKVEFKYEY